MQDVGEHEHVYLPQHRHHFETEEQQREAGSFGMWLFLLTEIMFFGGMFFAYLLFRNWYYDAFVAASNTLNIGTGAANTAILITSGFFMALGVWAAEVRKRKLLVWMLILTTIFGCAFLGVKYFEYKEKFELHHIPGTSFDVSQFAHPPIDEKTGKPVGNPVPEDQLPAHATLLLPLLRHDRHARAAHDHRHCDPLLAAGARATRRVQCRLCGAHRKLRSLLALCRYCVDISVPTALPDQPSPAEVSKAIGERN